MGEEYSPYCPICTGCGEEGCCSPLGCEQHPDGRYCQSYLRDLKFGYRMDNLFQKEIFPKLSEELKKEYEDMWDKTYDEYYRTQ